MGILAKIVRSQHLERVILIAAALTIAGCGSLSPEATPVPATATPDQLTPTPTATPTPEPTPMISTLELWLPEELDPYGTQPGSGVLAAQLAEFSQRYPGLKVDVVVKKAHGRGGLVDFMRTARDAAPSVLPDLVVLDAADLGSVARSDLVQPLDDLLASSASDDHFPFATSLGKAEGETMGAVVGVDMQHLAYRPTVFATPPVSWTQVISAPASFLFPAGGVDGLVNDATLIQYLGAGGSLTNAEGHPSLDEAVLTDVFSFYTRCITNTVIPATQILTATHVDQVWEQFKDGEAGMTAVRARRYWLEADDTMVAGAIPTKDGRPVSIARGWALAVVTDDPARQDVAMLLFDWLTAPEQNALWTQTASYLPATRSALDLWAVTEEERTVLHDLLEAAVPLPRPLVMEAVGPPMQEALEAVLNGRATPEEAAASAVRALEN